MKKRLLTLQIVAGIALMSLLAFVPVALAGLSTGDGTWQWVSPPVQGNNVNSLSFVNGSIGWAAGNGGLVMKTTDGGTTWAAQTPSAFASPAYSCSGSVTGSGCNLRGVSFVSTTTGWAVGDYGNVWKTTDGGSTWTQQTVPAPYSGYTLRSVSFLNASSGVIAGDGVVLYTVNGGTNWTAGTPASGSFGTLYSVQMLDANTAVAVGSSGAIWRTVNGGSTWSSIASGTSKDINSVYFTTTSSGFAVGGGPGGQILRTTNGGTSWEASTAAITNILSAVTITDAGNTLIATGLNGTILRRSTASNWTDPLNTVVAGLSSITSNTTSNLYAVNFPAGGATGYTGGVAGTVLASSNSGSNWSSKAGGGGLSYYGSSFLDKTHGWVVGEAGTVRKTVDGGTNWTDDNTSMPGTTNLWSVNFRNANLGYAVGLVPGSPSTGVAYKYSSGSWSSMSLPAGVLHLGGVRMSDDTHGLAVGKYDSSHGNNGVILRTSDGSSWTPDTINAGGNTIYDINSVDTQGTGNGWAVGQAVCTGDCQQDQVGKGALLKYESGTWTAQIKTNVSYFDAIDMVDGSTGYAVGYQQYSTGTDPNKVWYSNGRIFKTTDGGTTWVEQLNGGNAYTSKVMSSVSFLDVNTGYATAGNIGEGRILKTTNGGSSWSVVSAGTNVDLYNVSTIGTGGEYGYATYVTGGNSATLKYLDSSLPPVQSPFLEKMNSLSGALGNPTDVEHAFTGGKYQDFTNGRLYLNDALGSDVNAVKWVHGAILTKYAALGGESGALGLPTSDETGVSAGSPVPSGSRQNTFDHGAVYWGPGIGTFGISGKLWEKYNSSGGPATNGLPIDDQKSCNSPNEAKKYQATQKAVVTWNGNSGDSAYVVFGGIMWMYMRLGGPDGPYGVATTDEMDATGAPGGRESDFEAGRLYWSINTGTHGLQGTFLDRFLNVPGTGTGGPGANGLPTGDAYYAQGIDPSGHWANTGFAQDMQNATATIKPGASPSDGKLVRAGINAEYRRLGGPLGSMHLITMEEHAITVAGHPDDRCQPGNVSCPPVEADFEVGYVFWSISTGSHAVMGGIYDKYLSVGGPQGALGLPTTGEYAISLPGGGVRQAFEHGFITWGARYGTWVDYT